MRLREMKYELEQFKGQLKVKEEKVNVNTDAVRVLGIDKVNNVINEINKFRFIDQEYDELMTNHINIFNLYIDRTIVNRSELSRYLKIVHQINLKLDAVIDAISVAIDNQEENTISIKLPPFTDLKLVSNFIRDVEKIFKSVLPDKNQSEIKLGTFDTGSNWIEIIVSKMESIVIIGEFMKIATELAKKILSTRNTTKLIETTGSFADEAKQMILNQMKQLEIEQSRISVEAFLEREEINKEDISSIQEYKSELNKQMLLMADYLIQGAEVKPALTAPEEHKQEFPSDDEYKLLHESTKQLLISTTSSDELEEEKTITEEKEQEEKEQEEQEEQEEQK